MSLTPITDYHRWLQGTAPLPAGAVPLAGNSGGALICLMPTGRWIMWIGGVMSSMPPTTQREVMEVVIDQLGGTAASAAHALNASPRTVESWRSNARPLNPKTAYQIAKKISNNKPTKTKK